MRFNVEIKETNIVTEVSTLVTECEADSYDSVVSLIEIGDTNVVKHVVSKETYDKGVEINKKVTAISVINEAFEYPLYRKLKGLSKGKLIAVKFFDKMSGSVVVSANDNYEVGYTSNNWSQHENNLVWEPFDYVAYTTEKTIYPLYMKSIFKNRLLVVKFTDMRVGEVIIDKTKSYKIGSIHSDWNKHEDNSTWKPFDYDKYIREKATEVKPIQSPKSHYNYLN